MFSLKKLPHLKYNCKLWPINYYKYKLSIDFSFWKSDFVIFSIDGDTITVGGRVLQAIKSTIDGQATVIGYIYKDYATGSAPSTPAPNGSFSDIFFPVFVYAWCFSSFQDTIRGWANQNPLPDSGAVLLPLRLSPRMKRRPWRRPYRNRRKSLATSCRVSLLLDSLIWSFSVRFPFKNNGASSFVWPISAVYTTLRTREPALGAVPAASAYFGRKLKLDLAGESSVSAVEPAAPAPQTGQKICKTISRFCRIILFLNQFSTLLRSVY